jgi:hypothetical protein
MRRRLRRDRGQLRKWGIVHRAGGRNLLLYSVPDLNLEQGGRRGMAQWERGWELKRRGLGCARTSRLPLVPPREQLGAVPCPEKGVVNDIICL